MKLRCKLLGHKPVFNPAYDIRPHCERCDWQDYAFDVWLDNFVKRQEHELKMSRSEKAFQEQSERVAERMKYMRGVDD